MIDKEVERLENVHVGNSAKVNEVLRSIGTTELISGSTLSELMKRPEVTYEALAEIDPERPELPKEVISQAAIQIRYKGYIEKQIQQVAQYKKLESKMLPEKIDYYDIQGLRIEAQQKLARVRPRSMGQASRISGVSPADMNVLMVYVEQYRRRGGKHE